MFTGIITDVGEVIDRREQDGLTRLVIACGYPRAGIALGASIACNGACLTVIETHDLPDGRTAFAVEASGETTSRTTLAHWHTGTRLNLERALKIGDELGGHIVTGHVDGVATIAARVDAGGVSRFDIDAPPSLARFIAEKGSVALDGTSLTVNTVAGVRFSVTLIPHTLAVTTWGALSAGAGLNIEVDMMARYAARLAQAADLG